MLNGKGNQYWMTKQYEEDRVKALEDRTKFDSDDLSILDIEDMQGRGDTNDDSFEFTQFPFPMDGAIKTKSKLDIRDVDPTIGGR